MEEKFDFRVTLYVDRQDIGGDFLYAHSGNWENEDLPTTEELVDSLYAEIHSWLQSLKFGVEVDLLMAETEEE